MLVNLCAKYSPASSGMPNPPIAVLELPYCSCRGWREYNTHVTMKDLISAKNHSKNMDNDLFFNSTISSIYHGIEEGGRPPPSKSSSVWSSEYTRLAAKFIKMWR